MDELTRAVEATLFAAAEPMDADDIAAHVGEGDVAAALAALADIYAGHGVELVERGGRWHFQTAPDLAHFAGIVPCGLNEPVTSLARLGHHVSLAEVDAALRKTFELRFGPVQNAAAAPSEKGVRQG